VQDTDDFNLSVKDGIENNVATERKALNPGSQLLSATPRAGLATAHLDRFVEFVYEAVRIRLAVVGDVIPNLKQVQICARAEAQLEDYFALFADFFSRAARLSSSGSKTIDGPLSKPSCMSCRSVRSFNARNWSSCSSRRRASRTTSLAEL
jgi:hypothetical protein